MDFTFTPLSAAALVPLYIWMTFRIVNHRRSEKISFGDGEDQDLLRKMRAHGNFAEYAPLGLVLLALMEICGTPNLIMALLMGMLVVGRYAHAYSFIRQPMNFRARVFGMFLTIATMGICAFGLLIHATI
ncbi:MAPEG family protein [Phaeobacter sp. C3_T13_0]|uniref:MAPEG family protein n=1 Tax=Phaeobacter cretensis TaxID=3342641 RepID=UPI0039BCC618